MNAEALKDDDLVRLADAPALFFPCGGVTLNTLRTEIRRGTLVPERIGGKYFVTPRAIREMRLSCRAPVSRHALSSDATGTASGAGLSATSDGIAAQAALLAR